MGLVLRNQQNLLSRKPYPGDDESLQEEPSIRYNDPSLFMIKVLRLTLLLLIPSFFLMLLR